jgi:dipeptidyl aminopeptidase/acylaminoacyl peptidase
VILAFLVLAALSQDAEESVRLEELVRRLDAEDASLRTRAQAELEDCLDRETRVAWVRERLKTAQGEVRGRLQEALDAWEFRQGDRIAFVTGGQVWIMSSRGKFARQLTDKGENLAPAFSPDGKRIAFASDRSGTFEIHVIDVDGRNEVRLTRSKAGSFDPVFSPDGKRVAFSVERAGKGIRSVDAAGSSPEELSETGEWPSFSPDGKRLLLTGRVRTAQGDLFLRELGTKGEPLQITETLQPMALNFHARFSPDGSRIIFAGWNPGAGGGLYLAKGDGTERKVLRDPAGSFYAWPSFSPDGRRILCCRTPGEPVGMIDRHFRLRKPEVVLLEEGKEDVVLGEGSFPAWSPKVKP